MLEMMQVRGYVGPGFLEFMVGLSLPRGARMMLQKAGFVTSCSRCIFRPASSGEIVASWINPVL